MLQWQPVQRTHECKYIPCNDIAGEQSNYYETSFYTFREQLLLLEQLFRPKTSVHYTYNYIYFILL